MLAVVLGRRLEDEGRDDAIAVELSERLQDGTEGPSIAWLY